MRYFMLLLPFVLAGCAYSYPVGYGYGYSYPEYAPGYGYYSQTPAIGPEYAYNGTGNSTLPNDTENCGTPFQFKACPPMPRHPLPYYPANRS